MTRNSEQWTHDKVQKWFIIFDVSSTYCRNMKRPDMKSADSFNRVSVA